MSQNKCDRCDGCGLVATDDYSTPWSHLVGANDQDEYVVGDSTYYPVTCGRCNGTGTPRKDAGSDMII